VPLFTLGNLLGDIGGYLGLLLGWSFFSIFSMFIDILKNIFKTNKQ